VKKLIGNVKPCLAFTDCDVKYLGKGRDRQKTERERDRERCFTRIRSIPIRHKLRE